MDQKFKIGDSVKIIKGGYGQENGDVGKVIGLTCSDWPVVEVEGRKSSSFLKPGVGYAPSNIKLITDPKPEKIINNYSIY